MSGFRLPRSAILLGAALVFFLFPRKEREQQLLAAYTAEDAAQRAVATKTDLVPEQSPKTEPFRQRRP